MSIVDRYFVSEIAKVFGTILATLLLVMASMLFLRTLEQVNIGALAADSLLRFLALQMIRDTPSLLPPAFFIATLVALGRMARDSELIAFQAGGLGPVRVYRALLLVALPLALVTGWLSLVMKPYASMEIQRIEDLNDDEATQASGLQPGRFYQQENGRVTFYAAEVGKDNRFRAVFVQDRRGDSEQIVLSRTGYYTEHEGLGDRAIVLEDGRRFVGTPGEYDYSVADFERFTYFLKIGPADAEQQRRRSAMPTAQLLASDEPRDRAELQHRLSAPLAVLTLVLLAIPLTTLSPRQRGGGRLFLAFVAYFAFFNLQRLAESWMETGVTPAWLGTLWYQPFIVATVGAALVPGSFWVRRLGAAVRAAVGRAGDRR